MLPAFGGKDLHIVEGNGREEQVPLLLTELAGKKHRAKGFMGKFILSDANELKAYIEGGE